ncbi:hypothetical protein AX17_005368 [Amanita inopinata Kibby_2008]|nr:hypothetical protein AX17_005368 [Amanita inopinata Kibby_2008]
MEHQVPESFVNDMDIQTMYISLRLELEKAEIVDECACHRSIMSTSFPAKKSASSPLICPPKPPGRFSSSQHLSRPPNSLPVPLGPPPPYSSSSIVPSSMPQSSSSSTTLSRSYNASASINASPSQRHVQMQAQARRVPSHLPAHAHIHGHTQPQPHTHASNHAQSSYLLDTHPDSSDNDDDDDDDGAEGPIYTSWGNGEGSRSGTKHSKSNVAGVDASAISGSSTSTSGSSRSNGGIRFRFWGFGGLSKTILNSRDSTSTGTKIKTISTAPGQLCAGETETEADEPPRHLPTARIVPSSDPIIPPNTLQQQLTPFLFEFSRLLAIVPAVIGTLYNLYHVYNPPTYSPFPGRKPPERIDFFVSALWSVLTGYQCLALTTGLLTRWRLYYPPLSTLIRLLALQGICWPATQLTLSIFEHEKRPVTVWALIGTTTCTSRSIQIWVTSNLWWETRVGIGSSASDASPDGVDGGVVGRGEGSRDCSAGDVAGVHVNGVGKRRGGYWRRWGGGRWGGRRWDWKEVGVKCMLPAGIMYFVMAWAEQLRREWEAGC